MKQNTLIITALALCLGTIALVLLLVAIVPKDMAQRHEKEMLELKLKHLCPKTREEPPPAHYLT